MTGASLPGEDRLLDLMAEHATSGLDADARQELQRLCAPRAVAPDAFEHAAAACYLGTLRSMGRVSPMPRELRDRLQALAARRNAPARGKEAAVPTPVLAPVRPAAAIVPRRTDRMGWLAAAAMLLVLLWQGLAPGPGTPLPGTSRASLLRQAPDAVTLPWHGGEPGFQSVQGDVVWSDARQEGYLRLVGLQANAPGTAQYQLWIVDPDRDPHPVDGGVFDVSGEGEVVIPIRAVLPVHRPSAFAITLEQPGGVVVSDGPLLVVASL